MQKLALIDNNDSFTYNIVDYLRKIPQVELQIFNCHELVVEELYAYDKIILSPGPELPKNFPNLAAIINRYMKEKPILGICLGHQAIGEFFGAKLQQRLPVVHGQDRTMKCCAPSPLWHNLPEQFQVALYHSWYIDQHSLPAHIIPLAYADEIIMAIAIRDLPIWGIQFHPESYITENGLQILENFMAYGQTL